MRISSEDMNDLYVNRVDTFHIMDCAAMRFAANPELRDSIGILVQVKHQESNLRYRQLFFLKRRIAERLHTALEHHLYADPTSSSDL